MNPNIKEVLASKIASITRALETYSDNLENESISGVQNFNSTSINDLFDFDYYEGMREGIWYVMYLLGEDFVKEVNRIVGSIENEIQEQNQPKVPE